MFFLNHGTQLEDKKCRFQKLPLYSGSCPQPYLASGLRPGLMKVVVGHDLGHDEAFLHVRVDTACRLGGLCELL